MPLNHGERGSMSGDRPQHDGPATRSSFWKSKAGLVAIAFLLIGAFFLLSEHRAHVFGYLPLLLILACPLLHVFMHGGHGGHGGHGAHKHSGRNSKSSDTGADS
jgi:hypothetical protein